MGQKIGIFGGTFNPLHNGHLLIAEAALKQHALEKIIFIPNGTSYMKQNLNVVGRDDRFSMVSEAIVEYPYYEASDIEVSRPGNSYTYETLLQLKEIYPEDEFYFILGADCLFTIEKWKEVHTIFKNCIILAALRNDYDYQQMQQKSDELTQKYAAKIQFVTIPKTDISSTMIREKLHNNESIDDLVPEKVALYIKNNHLYKNE